MSALPPGIRIGSGVTLNDERAVRIDLSAKAGSAEVSAYVVVLPREARALAALLLRQADLIEGSPFRSAMPYPTRLRVVEDAEDDGA